jgi:3-oxoacyl-[acyl-carrier protein] reductase
MGDDSKRVAVVTGAGAGIGAAVAVRLATAHRDLALIDIDEARLAQVAERARAAGAGSVMTLTCDTRESETVSAAFDDIRVRFGRIDILANVVGGSTPHRPIEEMTDDHWHATMRFNLDGLFFCTRAVVRDMKARRWGRIVNTSSLAGRTRSLFGGVDYGMSKAGVIGFTRQLAYDVAPFGIAANVVAPGVTSSERVIAKWEAMADEKRNFIQGLIPAARLGTADECAAAIAFLCSEDAGYINGAVLDVNGGMFIG